MLVKLASFQIIFINKIYPCTMMFLDPEGRDSGVPSISILDMRISSFQNSYLWENIDS